MELPQTQTTPPTPGPDGSVGVIAAIARVAASVGPVAKSRPGEFGRKGAYNYRGIDDVVNAVNPPWAENQLVLIPTVAWAHPYTIRYKNGDTVELPTAQITFTVAHADGSYITGGVHFPLEQTDIKAWGSVMSYALRYWLGQLLLLPTDDPSLEPESSTYHAPEAATATAPPRQAIAFADKAAVAELLNTVQGLDEGGRAEFKAKQAQIAAAGEQSWSFATSHVWLQPEYDAAAAWLAHYLKVTTEAAVAASLPGEATPPAPPTHTENIAAIKVKLRGTPDPEAALTQYLGRCSDADLLADSLDELYGKPAATAAMRAFLESDDWLGF